MHEKIPEKRDLNGDERALIERLLSNDFPGRSGLAVQLAKAKVAYECECGCPSIILELSPDAVTASVLQRVPVEAETLDFDGMGIHALLHTANGFLRELEIFREDSGPINSLPPAPAWRVTAFNPHLG